MLYLWISEPIASESWKGLQTARRRRRCPDGRWWPTTAAVAVSPLPCYSCATIPHRAGGA